MQGSKRETDVKNRLLDYVGEGEGGVVSENSIETCMYITICKIDGQCKFDARSRALKASALGQPRGLGWGVQDGGTHVHPRVIHTDVWQKPPQYCKIVFFQLK